MNKKYTTIKENEYRCEICNEVYKKGQSDEDAEKEMMEIWGDIPNEERMIICDDCFNRRTMEEIIEMGNEYKSSKS